MATDLKVHESKVDWVGSLSTTPLAEVFHRIATEEKSGDLQVNLGSAIKSVYFDHGFVVFSASNLKKDRLGESLIEAGRISRHEFALVSMLMKGNKRKFGQTLVQAGVMSEEELGKQVAAQVNRIVMSLFKIKDAVYSFDERESVIPVSLMVSLSIYRILLEGVRHMTDGRLILAGLPPLNTEVRVAERPPFTIEPRKLKRLEQTILKDAGKGTPLNNLAQNVGVDRGVALRACYGLFTAGLLEPAEGGRRRPLKVQEETGVFVLSDIQQKFADPQATSARQEILMEFDRLDRTPEKDLLQIDGPVEDDAIERAFEARRSEWDKKRALVEEQNTLVTKVDAIQERLREAYQQLRDEPRDAPERSDDASTEIDEEAFEAPVAETLPPLNDEMFEDETEFEIEDPFAETAGPSADALSDDPEAVVDDEPPIAEKGPATGSVDPNNMTTGRQAQLSGSARADRVRQLLRDVKLHFQVRDWEHAVSLLFELVELEPTVAQHHGMLARAMARHPVMRKDAERHFIEALRIAPQDADLHFTLGLYYKSFGMHARAQIEFRTALRIRPLHEGAKKHLSTGGKGKDPLRDMFKKIFG